MRKVRKHERLRWTICDDDPTTAYFEACRRAKVAKDCAFAVAKNTPGYTGKAQEARVIRSMKLAYMAGVEVGHAKARIAMLSNDPKARYMDWRPGKADLVGHA